MKRGGILVVLLFCIIGANILCRPGVNMPVTPPSLIPIPNSLIGRWTLTDIQSAGTAGPGIWSVANPPGQWMDIQPAGQISGAAFPNATGYQVIDSLTLKVMDPSQSAGFRLFGYHVDTSARALFFYTRPPGGGACIEGFGGLGLGGRINVHIISFPTFSNTLSINLHLLNTSFYFISFLAKTSANLSLSYGSRKRYIY